ncbi:hypothetical protein RKLH11_1779 [Rhodobacteraceae bacterium KLH11]|nr:hypothetical protein RKLH11_1779 [Rhodobacteraceae bacterium KLH11]
MILTGKRIKICAFWGTASPDLEAAGQELAKILTGAFGGVSMSEAQGYWAPDGNNRNGPYDLKDLQPEATLRIELLVLEQNRDRAIETLEESCRDLNRKYDLGSKYLHIECAHSMAFHKDIS